MKFGGNIQNMLKQAEKIKEQIEKLQAEAGEKTVEATSGGGMVTAVAKEGDIEMLQDLITAAVNEALNRGRDMLKEELSRAATSFGLPPGLL